ncbi:hypothetical protein Tco_1168057 [Tanacetum coccineum]
MAESSSQKTSSPDISPKEKLVTLDKLESPNPFLPASQVDFTFDEITFTTNNEVALLYSSHPNQYYFEAVLDFISVRNIVIVSYYYAGRPNMVPAGRTIVSPGSIIFGLGSKDISRMSDHDDDASDINNDNAQPQQQQNIQPQIITTVSNNNAKFPYLKKDKYEVWINENSQENHPDTGKHRHENGRVNKSRKSKPEKVKSPVNFGQKK